MHYRYCPSLVGRGGPEMALWVRRTSQAIEEFMLEEALWGHGPEWLPEQQSHVDTDEASSPKSRLTLSPQRQCDVQ